MGRDGMMIQMFYDGRRERHKRRIRGHVVVDYVVIASSHPRKYYPMKKPMKGKEERWNA